MKALKDDNHIIIHGWMRTRFALKGSELLIYAIIYGFSQDGETAFYGSRRYMAEAAGIALPSVDRVVNSLIEKGLIQKEHRVNDGVSHCHYLVVLNDDNTTYQKNNTPYQNDNTPYQKNNTHNNNKDNNKENKEKNKDKSLSKNNKEGYIFENDMEANFFKWCYENVPNLMENKRPLKYSQFISLQGDGYPKQTILDKMLYMDAKAGFNDTFKNVYAVLKNWLASDRDPNYRERFKSKKNKEVRA